jgi:hypothetical protein
MWFSRLDWGRQLGWHLGRYLYCRCQCHGQRYCLLLLLLLVLLLACTLLPILIRCCCCCGGCCGGGCCCCCCCCVILLLLTLLPLAVAHVLRVKLQHQVDDTRTRQDEFM